METLAPKRIVLIGPECTGKTELAQFLAQHFGATVSLEYAREYAEARANELTADDVEPIARGEMALLDRAIAAARELVVHDTDLLSTVVYARHYYGSCPEWIEAEARARCADHYLLLDTDLPWIADAARDAGGDAREDLFDAFRAALDEFACRWTIVSGDREARERAALDVVNRAIAGLRADGR
jgi:NadR type nicotinamide-nucleotide adenylyltransferase